jgi:hypothetical protein
VAQFHSRLRSPLTPFVEPDSELIRFFDARGKYEETRVAEYIMRHVQTGPREFELQFHFHDWF